MRLTHPFRLALTAAVALSAGAAFAEPIITGLVENNRNTAVPAAIVSSATNPSPSGTSAELKDRAFAMVNRNHQYTAVRTDPATNLLSTNDAHNLQAFPSYLVGLEYIQIANENRAAVNYSLDVTLSQPVVAYLFLDNRLNDNASANDPVLTGNLQWVVDDGWVRVNTGFMPNGQADYLGIDEIGTVASEDLRSVSPTPGSGIGVNQFFAIYSKQFAAGTHIGFTKQQNAGSYNVYGVAVAPVPEPSIFAMLFAAALAGLFACRVRGKR